MKKILGFFIIMVLVTACKATKNVTDTSTVEAKRMSARKIVKKHLENTFTATTLDSKIKAVYTETNDKGERSKNSFTVRLRMQKDSVIWIKANKVITVLKAKITPKSFSFYIPVPKNKSYFEGDYETLKKMIGIDVSFDQLQNILFGQSIFDLKERKYIASVEEMAYTLRPKVQEKLFDLLFKINAGNFKVNEMHLTNENKQQNLRLKYGNYKQFQNMWLPMNITINAKEGVKYTFIDLAYKSITLDKPINIPYRIPSSSAYKRLVLK